MSLQVGTRLGVYEVLASLGAGGMGEVYRARDTRLGRDVALKILPDAFASDSERLARFEREARTLAALNHPHIAQIHGFEESGPTRALVMELVEGPDLADRLRSGPLAIEEAIAMARQIAEAVEAAHELGIIHRDLKPANIKVRPDGTVKVLDFGLAKALVAPEGSTSSSGDQASLLAHSPTFTSPAMTAQGIILGTAAYMAPEQAKGKIVDKRVDIWAFGCVLYEMLTGRRPFGGDDISDTLAHVLTKDVDWSGLPASTPAGVRALLRRCLQKNPRERLRDIGDARMLLLDAATLHAEPTLPAASAPRHATWLPWAITAAAVLIAGALVIDRWRVAPPTATATARFVIPPPQGVPWLTHPLIGPDGSFVVFAGDRLYIRRLAEFEARPLPGTENADEPFLSPDGRWVAFYADGKLKKVAIAGGDPIVICDVEADSPGAAWMHGNRILFTPSWAGTPFMSVSADGGPITPASTLKEDEGERGHWWAEPLPDRRHVLFTIWPAGAGLAEAHIGVLDLDTGQHRRLFPGASARYAAGHLLFFRAGVYQAVRFDPDALTMLGEPQIVLADALALHPGGSNTKAVSISATGALVYVAGDLFPERSVSWIARDGRAETLPFTIRHTGITLSPDATQLAYARPGSGRSQIAVYDLARNTEQRLQSPGYNFDPVWHPTARRLGFTSMRRGDFDAFAEPVSGGQSDALLNEPVDESLIGWLPDATRFVARIWDTKGGHGLFLIDSASKARTPLAVGPFESEAARISPDGRWLAFCANPAGNWQLYVRAIASEGALQPLSSCSERGGRGLHWSGATSELVFVRGADVVALSYTDRDDRFTVMNEQVVTRIGPTAEMFGVSPDGQRFLIGTRIRNPVDDAGIRVVVGGLEAIMAAPM